MDKNRDWPAAPAGRVVTSIPPLRAKATPAENEARMASARRAVASFEANGFSVTSVNAASEIVGLSPLFPTVGFEVPATQNGVFTAKYGPTFAALFAAGRSSNPCAIINADIYLVKGAARDIVSHDNGTFLVARRADIQEESGRYIGTYGRGIDALFFDPARYLPLIEDSAIGRFQLGAPFWDLVIPVVASFHGTVSFLRAPVILHSVHEAKWSEADYRVLRIEAANAVLQHARKHAPTSGEARRFLNIAERLVGRRERVVAHRQVKKVATLIDVWLKRIEAANTTTVTIDPNDPVLASALRSTSVDHDLLAELQSDWGGRKAPPPGIVGSIRMTLRRQRIARRARKWAALFAASEEDDPAKGS